MQGRANLMGQPLNPLLTVLPLGILGSAVLVDLGALMAGSRLFSTIAQADMAVGLLTGVVSLCAILIDLITAPAASVARQALTAVAALTGTMMGIFMVIWSVRAEGDGTGSAGGFLLELLALGAGIVGAVLARRLALGHGLPPRYVAAGVLAGRYLLAAQERAVAVVRRGSQPLGRLLR